MKNYLIILLLFLSIGCSQKEYDIKQIVKRDGVYYPEFNDEDLNGRVYEMFGFKKVYMGIIKNGKQDGLWTDWYENGQKSSEVTYKDSKKDGLYTGWYENGKKERENTYKDGKFIDSICWDRYGNECECSEYGSCK